MGNKKQTSPRVARNAAKVLANPKSSALEKSAAGSALVQARGTKKKRG